MWREQNPYVFYVTFIGAVGVIVLGCLTVYILIARLNLESRDNEENISRAHGDNWEEMASLIQGSVGVAFLVSVTWISGLMAARTTLLSLEYIFCFTNAGCGILIFVLRCLIPTEARLAWGQLCKTGTLRTKQIPLGVHRSVESSPTPSVRSVGSNRSSRDLFANNVIITSTSQSWRERGDIPHAKVSPRPTKKRSGAIKYGRPSVRFLDTLTRVRSDEGEENYAQEEIYANPSPAIHPPSPSNTAETLSLKIPTDRLTAL